MLADFPPSSKTTGVSESAAAFITACTVATPPVNEILSIPGWRTERVAGDRPTGHDVERAGREPGLEGELGEAHRAERRDLGWLRHHCVPGRQRGDRLLSHPHHGPVPRWDDRDHSVWLVQHQIDVVGRVHGRDIAGELVDPARVVARPGRGVGTRIDDRDGSAVVERVDGARLLAVLVEEVGETVQDADPRRDGNRLPDGECERTRRRPRDPRRRRSPTARPLHTTPSAGL